MYVACFKFFRISWKHWQCLHGVASVAIFKSNILLVIKPLQPKISCHCGVNNDIEFDCCNTKSSILMIKGLVFSSEATKMGERSQLPAKRGQRSAGIFF